ncbi:Spy/CpxP family protein refolding chaperone [Massilia sp. METH4]|uniref:Spy/CpxP family protein refolding chaperone n=1 Tax=Massilia sp. METH4 TaxID=3123041 RepID=UPI0030D15481
MKNTTQNLQRLLLAAVLALPLGAMADNPLDEAPGEGPGQGPRGHGPAMREEDGPRGPRGEGPGFGHGFDGAQPYLRGIELTEAQQDKIFAIVHGQVPYLREQARARDKADRALLALHGAGKYDDAAAVKLAQAAAQADANITLSHLRTEQKVLAVLTAEQRKQLDERGNGRAPRPGVDRDGGPARPGR